MRQRGLKKINHLSVSWLAVALFWFVGWMPFQAFAERTYGPHEGYLSSVDDERTQTYSDLQVVKNPDSDEVPLSDRIFNESLVKEFKERYEERFGRTEALQAYFAPNRDTYIDNVYGFQGTMQDEEAARRSYANYMLRRLAEYHAERYFKSNDNLKGAWDVKEAVTQAQVGGKGFNVKAKYNPSSNLVDVDVQNPLVKTKLTTRPDGRGSQDSAVVVSRDVTPSIEVESRYKFEGTVYLIGNKKLSPALSTNITLARSAKNNTLLTNYREDLILAGLSYHY